MSVSFRTVGTWAELTADGTVAIPATPQAGDRMYLFARWKDFSITATVTNWTELTEFADGSTSAGNGTGSVKVACWYRDWQLGDSNPTIDFSASPDNASVVIIVMQKAADDVWTTPLFVTAAMTNWTTTSQIVPASSTVVVPSGGVVMGLIGIRDDTATMTRPTSGIDDSASAITWNGDYVEAPATHHSTTTGLDGAADLGYRLVSIGATATLRMTGTISAAETGAALWVVQGVNTVVIPSQSALSVTTFAPTFRRSVFPANVTLTISGFVPSLRSSIVPASVSLTVSPLVLIAGFGAVPETASLTVSVVAPFIQLGVTPSPINLITASSPSLLVLTVIPPIASLVVSPFGASLSSAVVPSSQPFSLALFAPLLTLGIIPLSLSLSSTGFPSSILPFGITWLDPGGDAVQAVGYFNTVVTGGAGISYDTAQKVIGVGSYKFDSGVGVASYVAVPDVLGVSRRVSVNFRYDSVPDAVETIAEFVGTSAVYSGGGFSGEIANISSDDETYVTAVPAQNAGQGTVFGSFGFGIDAFLFPPDAVIESVKIIYERRYDVDTSIGISRVKWRVNGVEGPNHDNTDMPLMDTVVEIDVTGDREWVRDDLLNGVFEVIAEARRGDTATEHTQSWDYVKVEVQFHRATVILATGTAGAVRDIRIAINPADDGVVLTLLDENGEFYNGITKLLPSTWNRISFAYVTHGEDDLDARVYLNGIEELSVAGMPTAAENPLTDPLTHLAHGWLASPGENHICHFDQIYTDDGDDLSDPGNVLMTAKLPISVNDNEWLSTFGTGAVNERPISETNYRKELRIGAFRQTYTLQDAATGDIDVSDKTLIGHIGWAWTRMSADGEPSFLVVDGTDVFIQQIAEVPVLIRHAVSSLAYPSNAAGIGMLTYEETAADASLYECGVIPAYEGPSEDNSLLPFQLLAEDSTTNVSDTMDDDPPESYVLQSEVAEASDVIVTTVLSSSSSEGETPQQQAIIESQGGDSGIVTINPGIELSASVDVSGAGTSVGLRRVDELIV